MPTNNYTASLRPLHENERVSSLVRLFKPNDDSLSVSQVHMLQEIGRLAVNEYGLGPEPHEITSSATGMVRMIKRDRVSVDIARKTFFGPWSSELVVAENPDDEEGIFPGFDGVTFIALTPQALHGLDSSQKNEQDVSKFTVPKDFHQWQVVKKDKVVLSRISVVAPDDLVKWAEKIRIFGGVPIVISLAALDPAKSDVVSRSTSPIFGDEVLPDENIFQITEVPPGFEDLALRVSVEGSPTLGKVLDMLTLKSYKTLDTSE